jgi:hypothetical protein
VIKRDLDDESVFGRAQCSDADDLVAYVGFNGNDMISRQCASAKGRYEKQDRHVECRSKERQALRNEGRCPGIYDHHKTSAPKKSEQGDTRKH